MAQLERATSKRGKRYLAGNVAKFDDITFNNISGGTATLGGANNGNGVVQVKNAAGTNIVLLNKDGITLADGAKLINADGILTNFTVNCRAADFLSFQQTGWSGLALRKGFIEINFYIPSNFTMSSAIISLTMYKTLNEYTSPETGDPITAYGKATNIRAYKKTASYEWVNSTLFGMFEDAPPTGTEITNAFATGGYTNATTAEAQINSIDIKASLATGYNSVFITTANSVPNQATDAGTTTAAQQTQLGFASITIFGYKK